MTRITKLVLDGFKSFGKRTELLFSDQFNCVLGPNGSGKSNILDSLCFVLGKSSSKSLRAEKSANLIYNGGKTKNPSKVAEVSIFLDNSSKIFPLPEDEIKISRFVRHDGLSKYKINGKTKTRQEIVELLSSARLNPDGYNIILQGDIVRLVEMSTIERRQIIEEIAGISIYEEKKQQALNELTKVEEKLNEAAIILKERETYLKELKKDRDHALKYKELNDKIKQNKATYTKKKIDKKDEELKGLESKSSKHKERLDKLNNNISKLRQEIQERKDEIKKISDEIEQKSEVEQVKLQKDLETLRVDVATNKTRVSSCNNEINRINQRKDQTKNNLKEIEIKISELNQQKTSASDKKNELKRQHDDIENKIKEFKKKHQLGEDSDFEKRIETIDKNSEELQRIIQSLREKQQNLLRENDKLDFQIQTIDEKIAKVIELEKEHESEIKVLKQKKDEFKKTVLELNELLNNDSKQAGELAGLREQIQKQREEVHKLELKNANVQESISANIAVKKVIESRTKLGEIYGTVAELGNAPSKYAIALEVAAAQKVHSIVVEDDKTAARCIKFLKENKFGVATFLPLNKIKSTNLTDDIKDIKKEKGVHGLAIDLISFDPKFKNVFSYVFGSALVVDNIETARKIGIGKIKMVTIEGDLAELSGAMIGGYRQKKLTGAFKEKEVEESLDKAKELLEKFEVRINTLEDTRKQNEQMITRLRELKANLEGEIIKTEKSLHIDSEDLGASKNYKDELKQKIDDTQKQIDKINDEISETTKRLTDIKIEKQKIRDKINELKKPTLIAELNAFEQKRKELSEELIRLDAEIKNTEVQVKEIHERDRDNSQKILKEMDKEDHSFKQEIDQLNKKIKEQEIDLKKREEEQQKFFSQYKSLFEKRNRFSDEINARENQTLSLEEESRKQELEINTYSIEEARVKAELAGLATEFSQYDNVELLMDKSEEQLKKEINDFEKMMSNIGNVNMKALEIYDIAEKEYHTLIEKKDKLGSEKDSVLRMMEEIEGSKKDLFIKTLQVVDKNFQTIFKQLSSKGDAYLEVENQEKLFEEGLKIKVKLTGDKFLDIRSLSGGEKTITALAFLFAIQEHDPAPFYILDEVDAALDKHNSELLGKLIKQYCGKAQYIVISHNDSVISQADTLYGVSMNTDVGISNVVSLKT